MPALIPGKTTYGLFWDAPTFKDIDCNYLLHVLDQDNPDLIISTSSGNTVEGVARVLRRYNLDQGRDVKAILLVPEMSAYKVSALAIAHNPYVKYLVLRNATLDSTRDFAVLLKDTLSADQRIAMASEDLKASAYAQMGPALDDAGLFNEDTCYVQTVSGGVGPAGIVEAACEMDRSPELLLVQTVNGKSDPIVKALAEHAGGGNPGNLLDQGGFEPSHFEPTLGSTKPKYVVEKMVKWRESGGALNAIAITGDNVWHQKEQILRSLVQIGIYTNARVGGQYFDIEKSGFIAIAGAMLAARSLHVPQIVINFSGRRPELGAGFSPNFNVAIPYLTFDPATTLMNEVIEKLAE